MGINEEFRRALELHRQGSLAEARALYQQILAQNPGHAGAWHYLGVAAQQEGRPAEALDHLARALAARPDYAEAWNSLGVAHLEAGRAPEAAQAFQRAGELNPDYAEAHYNLGNALTRQDRLDEAVTAYLLARELDPTRAAIPYNLGCVLEKTGRLERAAQAYADSLALDPRQAAAWFNLGNVRLELAEMEDAAEAFQAALDLDPHLEAARDNLISALARTPGVPLTLLRRQTELWCDRSFPPPPPRPPLSPARGRPLRVGYVSGDFRRHPVGAFMQAILAHHDPARVEVFCYANQPAEDSLTARFREQAAQWRDLWEVPDAVAARLVTRDRIDVLVDLAGHTTHNRLGLFARRPAPLQAAYLGYWATTGLAAMDHIIADRMVIPPGEEAFYREEPLYLPGCYLCYTPPELPLAVAPAPALARGEFTFGCFNKLSKLNRQVIALWAELLRQTPGSRLFLKAALFTRPSAVRRVTEAFAAHGLDPDRLTLQGPLPLTEHYRSYHLVDLTLDPFPMGGFTTTCESLWMGAPVLTLAGPGLGGHTSQALLQTLGLPELVATTPEEYLQKAVRLAADPAGLDRLRQTLRPRLLASPLTDGAAFTRGLEDLLWDAWQRREAAAHVAGRR
ncbi:MAG: tetratricopeptide repeat protein [Deltaproteobacteria bacterium]|nr:tetratricopeptide repeat protein [Deltaproteobacteria bacterium]